jgi:hypothetical protein
MPIRTTIVTTLPRPARDYTWSATVITEAVGVEVRPCRVQYVRIDAEQLVRDLDAELRKVLGPVVASPVAG